MISLRCHEIGLQPDHILLPLLLSIECEELSFKVTLKSDVNWSSSIKEQWLSLILLLGLFFLIFSSIMATMIDLLDVHKIPRQDIMCLISRMWSETDQDLIEIRLRKVRCS